MKDHENNRLPVIMFLVMGILIAVLALMALYILLGGFTYACLYYGGGGTSYIEFVQLYFIRYKGVIITSMVLGCILLILYKCFGESAVNKIEDDKDNSNGST